MDALEYSILRITRHSSKPLPKHEIYTAIQQQRDRLPICWAGQTTVESLIDQLHDRGHLESVLVMPDDQEMVVGFQITDDGQDRLMELADHV